MILNVVSIQKTKKNEAALMEWVNNCENLECALSDNNVVSIDKTIRNDFVFKLAPVCKKSFPKLG
ncbi:hypothetical protein ABJS29_004531 [Salmonella enterica subsp. enterica serovar Bareilly]